MKNNLKIILVLLIAAILRLVALSDFPTGLNADEAAIGYNAYSLIQTGQDEHGNSWPLSFRSFDDYKPPLYFYITLPFVKILDLNTLAVRLPSALLGIATIYLVYLLVNQLFKKKEISIFGCKTSLGLLSALLLSVSPWHLHFSRGGWEANAAAFFLTLGILLAYKAINNKPNLYLPAALSIVASLYTYHSLRVIVPFLGLAILIIYWKEIKKSFQSHQRIFIFSIVLTVALSIPLLIQFFSGAASSRFSGVSIFADSGPLWRALEKRRSYGSASNTLWVRALHNRYLSYSIEFLKNYLSHFSPSFLFLKGDKIARSKVPGLGQSYLFLAPFVVLGLVKIALNLKNKSTQLLLSWLLISPIAAALTFQSPHALRSQNMVIPLTITTAWGVLSLLLYLKDNSKPLLKIFALLFFALLVCNTAQWAHQYTVHYPRELPFAWEPGFQQLGDYLENNQNRYQKIIITDKYDQPYILTAFFLKYPPKDFQKSLVFTNRDKFGFSTGKSFGKFVFQSIDWQEDSQNPSTLIVTDPDSAPSQPDPLKTIYYPNQEPVFKIYSTDKISP